MKKLHKIKKVPAMNTLILDNKFGQKIRYLMYGKGFKFPTMVFHSLNDLFFW
jgi:hypothetical protein